LIAGGDFDYRGSAHEERAAIKSVDSNPLLQRLLDAEAPQGARFDFVRIS
jgi:hypothetical protein